MAKTTEQLLQQAVQIRDEQANKKNTALRVGTLFSDIIEKQAESDQTHATDVTKINEAVTENRVKVAELDRQIGTHKKEYEVKNGFQFNTKNDPLVLDIEADTEFILSITKTDDILDTFLSPIFFVGEDGGIVNENETAINIKYNQLYKFRFVKKVKSIYIHNTISLPKFDGVITVNAITNLSMQEIINTEHYNLLQGGLLFSGYNDPRIKCITSENPNINIGDTIRIKDVSLERTAYCDFYNSEDTSILRVTLSKGSYVDMVVPEGFSYLKINQYGNVEVSNKSFNSVDKCVEDINELDVLTKKHTADIAKNTADIANIVSGSDNPLNGKKIVYDGDSICEGVGFEGGYGKIIAERNNMVYENYGVAGATIRSGTNVGDNPEKPRHWISTNVLNLPTDADYVILEGGVNDSVNGDVMGTFDPYFTNDTYDSTTFYGAMDTMCKNLYDRFPGKKVGFIIVHAVSGWIAARDTPRYVAAKKVLNKWGVPYIDLNVSCPPFGLIAGDNELVRRYTAPSSSDPSKGDGWHPNEDGYKKYYCDKIESWLKSL